MRRETLVIGVLVASVLLPMWYVALHGEPASEEIEIDPSVTEIRPLDGPVDTPNKLSPSQVGVIVWVALFGLYAALVGAHRFMNSAVRPSEADAEVVVSDGGSAGRDDGEPDREPSSRDREPSSRDREPSSRDRDGAGRNLDSSNRDRDAAGHDRDSPDRQPDGGVSAPSWLSTEERWLVEYHDATGSNEGILVMGALTVLAIVFSALFTGEYLTLARTQYFGLYAAGLFLSLAALTVAYYAWFMPHVEVAEKRGH